MLEHITTLEIVLGALYCLIVWLLFEASVATQRYYIEVHCPGRWQSDGATRHAIIAHSIFILPAVYHVGRFWWDEFNQLGGDT